MLAKGEVEEVVVRPGIDLVTIVLADGAIVKGQKVRFRTYHMNVADISKFEEKLRLAEERMGVPPGKGIPVVYQRDADTAGKMLGLLILLAIVASILSRMKGFRSPISMDSFVSLFLYFVSISCFKIPSLLADSNDKGKIYFGRPCGRRKSRCSIL